MDETTLPTPLYFFRHRRLLRALLIDDQVWFVLDDLRRLMGYASSERLANRLDEDQVRRQWLRLPNAECVEHLLVSESGVYAALIHFCLADFSGLRRWISNTVVPEVRSAASASGPRHVRLRWERQTLRVLDWQGQFWVSFGELPRLLREPPPSGGRLGWRDWARRLR
ncbi:BRO family protein [Pseudomonas panipatensis]|uniref:Prophage antirepressor n=1 Tax=Pseudomonas panipatensis TaxID=428992 RepID=A0A1G8FF80_9PSED|nr:BRO family protein [Pseudomonas panipatensis]SDH80712.1 Prophage antirepressor [Pseudomonas panipatensis]SMP54099.1 Prophage antirepressor [Pseudomonas panipatensis]